MEKVKNPTGKKEECHARIYGFKLTLKVMKIRIREIHGDILVNHVDFVTQLRNHMKVELSQCMSPNWTILTETMEKTCLLKSVTLPYVY